MSNPYISKSATRISRFGMELKPEERAPYSFDLEVTARCNLDCRYCSINLSAGVHQAMKDELTLHETPVLAASKQRIVSVSNPCCTCAMKGTRNPMLIPSENLTQSFKFPLE